MELHERVKYVRKEILNMSQTDLGNALGVNRDVINNIESNRLKNPEQKKPLLKLLASTYNINETWLLTGEGEMSSPVTKEQEIASITAHLACNDDLRSKFTKLFFDLTDEELQIIYDVACKIANMK